MKQKSQDGFTGVDISIAVIIIMLFVSLIATLIYQLNITSQKLDRQSQATYLAIEQLEKYKATPYEEITTGNTEEIKEEYKVVTKIENYRDMVPAEEQVEDILKVVTVTVNYYLGKAEQTIQMSTIVTKERVE